jgi:toxin secretion/phage lysis holin
MLFFIAIVIDFITGVLVGAKQGKLKSRTCSNGIFRTMGEFVILTIFLCIDYLIPNISGMLSTFIIAFVFKEGLSIIENLIKLDVYIPSSIKKAIEVGVEKVENKEVK